MNEKFCHSPNPSTGETVLRFQIPSKRVIINKQSEIIQIKVPMMLEKLPGIIATLIVTLLAYVLKSSFGIFGVSIWALLTGIVLGNLLGSKYSIALGAKICETYVLAAAIILMGFGLKVSSLMSLGVGAMITIILGVIVALGAAEILGKWLGFSKEERRLIGCGTAICGSSAIASCAPLITDKKEDIATSVGVVNLVGTLGIFVLPVLAGTFAFNATESGLLIGTSLQAVGHVVAAGYSVGDSAGEMATIVKMGRIALLVPLLIFLGFSSKKNVTTKKGLPIFIWGFLGFAILTNLGLIPESIASIGADLSKIAIAGALAAIGLSINLKHFVKSGSRLLLLGTTTSLVHLVFLVGIILAIA